MGSNSDIPGYLTSVAYTRAIKIACPMCGAAAQEPCIAQRSKIYGGLHKERSRFAEKLENRIKFASPRFAWLRAACSFCGRGSGESCVSLEKELMPGEVHYCRRKQSSINGVKRA